MDATAHDAVAMRRALLLASRGEGCVEPNPMVGAVVADTEGRLVAEGWHERFGGPHAEVVALERAGLAARGGTLYVTLEPCCHHGKTPPCTEAIRSAGISRVVVAAGDPFPAVNGGGISALRAGGINVETGLLETEALRLTAPFRKLISTGRPWVTAKWAMSLDGRIATATGESQWISGTESRALVHGLRGRVDAIAVGIGTALADDPLLTARPAGPRTALRIVFDSHARLPPASRLANSAKDTPVLVVVGPNAPPARVQILEELGCELWTDNAPQRSEDLQGLLAELGRRRLTNLLVEGGPTLLGSFFDARLVDEAWVFLAPVIIGGTAAPAAVGGQGIPSLRDLHRLAIEEISQLGPDLLVRGLIETQG
jgi:diaminohydroxyphosphoribosylaminopyrimidine deaminase/5-amino-6-(5-phosphoribosylamino)uracil reductase